MSNSRKNISAKTFFITALIVTLIMIVAWQATGGDYYTKFQVVEQVEVPLDKDDPLVAAGFYDTDVKTESVTRDEFRLGLLPTPSKLIDKHLLSVISISAPFWLIAVVLFFRPILARVFRKRGKL